MSITKVTVKNGSALESYLVLRLFFHSRIIRLLKQKKESLLAPFPFSKTQKKDCVKEQVNSTCISSLNLITILYRDLPIPSFSSFTTTSFLPILLLKYFDVFTAKEKGWILPKAIYLEKWNLTNYMNGYFAPHITGTGD
jgi:hypothetical protein